MNLYLFYKMLYGKLSKSEIDTLRTLPQIAKHKSEIIKHLKLSGASSILSQLYSKTDLKSSKSVSSMQQHDIDFVELISELNNSYHYYRLDKKNIKSLRKIYGWLKLLDLVYSKNKKNDQKMLVEMAYKISVWFGVSKSKRTIQNLDFFYETNLNNVHSLFSFLKNHLRKVETFENLAEWQVFIQNSNYLAVVKLFYFAPEINLHYTMPTLKLDSIIYTLQILYLKEVFDENAIARLFYLFNELNTVEAEYQLKSLVDFIQYRYNTSNKLIHFLEKDVDGLIDIKLLFSLVSSRFREKCLSKSENFLKFIQLVTPVENRTDFILQSHSVIRIKKLILLPNQFIKFIALLHKDHKLNIIQQFFNVTFCQQLYRSPLIWSELKKALETKENREAFMRFYFSEDQMQAKTSLAKIKNYMNSYKSNSSTNPVDQSTVFAKHAKIFNELKRREITHYAALEKVWAIGHDSYNLHNRLKNSASSLFFSKTAADIYIESFASRETFDKKFK